MILLFLRLLFFLALGGAGFLLFFYRDPERTPPPGDVILSPADGLIVEIIEEKEWFNIAIFMSPLNVHVQWVPYPGKVVSVERFEGQAKPGYLPGASKNNQVVTTLETRIGKVVVKQIVGIFVRRIETFVRVGDKVEVGQRLGRIVFGSRVELLIPKEKVELKVKKWQKVLAGLTIAAIPKI